MTETNFEFDSELLLEFIAESLEHLEKIEEQLMEYEQNPQDVDLIDAIFRAIHSIKGSSGFLKLDDINKLSHRLETVLDLLRKGERSISAAVMDVLFQGCDLLKRLLEEVNQRMGHDLDLGEARDNEQLSAIYEKLSRLLDHESTTKGTAEKEGAVLAEPASLPQASTGHTITPQLLEEFQVEAGEHLESCNQELVRLSEKPDDIEAVNEVFRGMHSIKGTSSYLGLTDTSKLAHAAESMLEVLRRRGDMVVLDEDLDLLFEVLDLLKELVADPGTPSEKARALAKKIEEKTILEKDEGGSAGKAAVRPTTNPLAIFLDAAEQHISTLKEGLACTEKENDQAGQVNMMFRAAQSLKSSARYMGFERMEASAAMMEEALESVRDENLELGPAVFDLVATLVADLEKALADIESNGENSASLLPESGRDTLRPEQVASPPPTKTQPPAATVGQQIAPPKTMRINQALLDTFMNLVGELIVVRNALGHIEHRLEMGEWERAEAVKEFRSATLSVVRISEEMQRTVMEMRMVPIRNVFQKVPRLLRDLTRKSGKRARIIFQGEGTEIDKGIAEELADPLVHIIRNCVDHGLESPDERKRAGKSEDGTIILRANHEGNFIIIEIIDDGRGINTDAVLAKAIEKGLVDREQTASLSHEDICGFIFKPGFSTAQKVTDISGRGVGMDVVLSNLKKLKGNVQVTSETGQGTKVRLEVPLTLALVDALLVQVAEQTFAMPLEAVAETVKVQNDSLKSLMRKKVITLRGEVVNIADLADLLGVTGAGKQDEDELTLLILKLGASKLGVIVDRIQRKEEIVVKPLADYLAAVPGLAGASVLGDGRSILILEPAELMALASGGLARKAV